MNIQELIKKYEEKYETVFGFPVIQLNQILEDLKQLDEPQKVTVPQFVADWFEKHKSNLEYELWSYIRDWEDQKPSEFKRWLDKSNNAFRTLVNMHQFGYEIKKEKRYIVKMKGTEGHNSYLKYNKNLKHWYFVSLFIYNNDVDTRTYHTRKELEDDGFDEVFNSPLFEVEEVEG